MTDPVATVLAVVIRQAGPARRPPDPGPDTPLGRDGFWLDSIDLVEVAVGCEHAFAVTLDGEGDLTPETMHSARTLAAVIERKLAR